MTECDSSLVRSIRLNVCMETGIRNYSRLDKLQYQWRSTEERRSLFCVVMSENNEECDGTESSLACQFLGRWDWAFGWTLGCKTPSNAGWFSPDAVTQNTFGQSVSDVVCLMLINFIDMNGKREKKLHFTAKFHSLTVTSRIETYRYIQSVCSFLTDIEHLLEPLLKRSSVLSRVQIKFLPARVWLANISLY